MTILLAALLAAAPADPDRPLAALATMPPPRAMAPTASAKPNRAQVLAAVRAEWGRYDTRHAGKLGPLEFATWVMRANGARVAREKGDTGVKPVPAMNATSRAFAVADADHDGGVTPEEMTTFLMR